MTLTLELTPEREQRIECEAEAKGLSVNDYVVKMLDKALLHERNLRKIAVLDSFMEEDGDEQRETWEALAKGLAESRAATRIQR